MENKTISDLNLLATVSDNDVLLVETSTETMKTTKSNLLKEVNEKINSLENNGGTSSKLKGLKWNAFGDSITEYFPNENYVAIIQERTGCIATNYGKAGRSIADRGSSYEVYLPAYKNYVDMNNDADIITVFCGTNDYGSQVNIGSITDIDNTKFYGALNTLALGLIEKYPGKKIAFITPIQRKYDTNGTPLSNYVNAIKAIGTKYGIPVLDLYSSCGLYPKSDTINNTYFKDGDGLHPNALGHQIFAPIIQNFLESLV